MGAILSPQFLAVVLRNTTPILFATLAVAIAAKSGVFNIAVEGMMLFAALIGVIFSAKYQNAFAGLFFAVVIGGFVGFLLCFLIVKLKTDATLTGVAFNVIASGGTAFLLFLVSGDKGSSLSLKSQSIPNMSFGFLDKIPFIGKILNNQNYLTILSLLLVIILHIFLYKSKLGLRIRAVGENPKAAESVGINVIRTQYIALIISGVIASLGGVFLSMGYLSSFSRDMTAGRGFIGLVANAMGRSTPIGGFIVSLIFGTADALANTAQTALKVPFELLSMIPYVTTFVGFALSSYIIKKKKEKSQEK